MLPLKVFLRNSLIIMVLLMVLTFPAVAQNYWIYLKDKDGVHFDPYEYFDHHTIERRVKMGYPVACITDYPVNEDYISAISVYADSTGFASRWFNAVAVVASDEALEKISALPFVAGWEPSMALDPRVYASVDYDTSNINAMDNLLERQVAVLGLEQWRKAGIDGTGVRIAVFDGGFPTYRTNPVLSHLTESNRILHTWDFTRKRECVEGGISHGTIVLSCIGGIINGKPVGLATGASYMLAITEVRSEPFREEQYWLAAAEWADKNGADIINSSLGYVQHRYHNYQMDGRTTFVTRAANMAAAKGILVVNAAGNSGADKWKIMGAPADADSVLSVGGLDPYNDIHTSFSSYGPTFDNRLKPNVVAYGHVIAAGKKKLVKTQGTSFASPLIAGFAACAWQSNRSLTNMELFRSIEKSGHLYPYFDYAHGYGIPQASFFLDSLTHLSPEPTFSLEILNTGEFSIVIDQMLPVDSTSVTRNYMYLHVRNTEGVLKRYEVRKIKEDSSQFTVNEQVLEYDETLCVHFRGYTKCIKHIRN